VPRLPGRRQSRVRPGLLLAALAILLAGCGGSSGSMTVLYAGSLSNLMEQGLGPAFQKSSGIAYQGQAAGSVALANAIKDRTKSGDVFISADPEVNRALMPDWLSWYVTFARTSLVVGYSPRGRFASDFEEAKNGGRQWYEVLQQPGLRLGRTDPNLDPKGYRTLFLLQLAEDYYHLPGLAQRILGVDVSSAQIFPEETLETRLESGALDAGFFYLNEAVEKRLPHLALPDEINLSSPDQAQRYAAATYTNSRGQTFKGAPILYTAAVLNHAPNPGGALAFVEFELSPGARDVMAQHGLLAAPVLYGGDRAALPASLQSKVEGEYHG